jgi:hypothetical protein
MVQKELKEHPSIGKTIHFAQPISYIERETPAIVPIVAKIKKEITGLHIKYDSEKKNEYLPSSTTFVIENVYTYKDLLNEENVYYILSSQDVKYILDEESLNRLQKPIYNNAKTPMKILDKLYKGKPYDTSKIRFYLSEKKGRYFDVFSTAPFKECNVQNIITNKTGIIAIVNFNQLSCLYTKLWDNIHSASYPVKYEVIE